jgi:hypothetical protein
LYKNEKMNEKIVKLEKRVEMLESHNICNVNNLAKQINETLQKKRLVFPEDKE